MEALSWQKVYDFCDRLHGHLARDGGYDGHDDFVVTTPKSDVQAYIASELQRRGRVGHGGASGGQATAEVAEFVLAVSAFQII